MRFVYLVGERKHVYPVRNIQLRFRVYDTGTEPDHYCEFHCNEYGQCLRILYLERERSDVYAKRNLFQRVRLSDQHP